MSATNTARMAIRDGGDLNEAHDKGVSGFIGLF
jgi:hypothetical protein